MSSATNPSMRFSSYPSFEKYLKKEEQNAADSEVGFHCVDSSGKTVYTNTTLEKIYGLSHQKIKGMTIFDFFPNDGRSQAEPLFKMHVNDLGNYTPLDDVRCLSSSVGETLDCEILISQTVEKVITGAQILLIYKRRKTETSAQPFTNTSCQELSRSFSPQYFPSLPPVEIMEVLYSTGDMRGIYRDRICIFMNMVACERQLGYHQKEFMASPLEKFVFPEDQQKAIDVYRESEMVLDTYIIKPVILRFVKKDGELIYFQLKIACIRNVAGMVEQPMNSPLISISFQDVTHLKMHIRIMGHELKNLLGPVKQIQCMKSDHISELRDVIANGEISAEIKKKIVTHLNIIESYTKLVHARVDAAAKRCTREINQFARAGKIVLQNNSVNLASTLEDCLEQWKIESQFLNINLHINELPKIQDLLVRIDVELLESILDNFIRNAFRAVNNSEPGKRNVYFSLVRNLSSDDKLSLHFKISDDGAGFCSNQNKPLQLNRKTYAEVFPNPTRSNLKIVQNGLGLSYSNKIINLMGGILFLSNNVKEDFYENSRTVVEFSLTFDIVNAQQFFSENNSSITMINSPEIESSSISRPSSREKDLEILVVEDDLVNGKMFLRILQKYQCICSWAKSGEEALEMCGKNKYDFIFMDFNLGSMSGIEVTKQILAMDSKNERTIVVGVTGEPKEDINEMGALVGMKQVFSKPIGRKGILEAIENHLPGKKMKIKVEPVLNHPGKSSTAMSSSITSGILTPQIPAYIASLLISSSSSFPPVEAKRGPDVPPILLSMNTKLQGLAAESPPLSPFADNCFSVASPLADRSANTIYEGDKLSIPGSVNDVGSNLPPNETNAKSLAPTPSGLTNSNLILVPLPVVGERSDPDLNQKRGIFVEENSAQVKEKEISEKGTQPKGNSVHPAVTGTDQSGPMGKTGSNCLVCIIS